MELRCQYRLHGHVDDGVLEIACRSRFCGKVPGVVVVHRYDLATGKLIETKRFRDPVKEEPEMGGGQVTKRDAPKEKSNGTRDRISLRHP